MPGATYPIWLAGNRITASLLNSGLPVQVIKPADQSLASNTTLANDNDLVIAVVANGTYIMQCLLDYEGGTQGAADLKWGWTFPAGLTMRYNASYINTSGTQVAENLLLQTSVTAAGSNGAGNLRAVILTGTVVVSSTAGNLQLQWAQNTSSATATIVHAQSYLQLQRVS